MKREPFVFTKARIGRGATFVLDEEADLDVYVCGLCDEVRGLPTVEFVGELNNDPMQDFCFPLCYVCADCPDGVLVSQIVKVFEYLDATFEERMAKRMAEPLSPGVPRTSAELLARARKRD